MLTVILWYYHFHFPDGETKTDGTGDLLTTNAERQQQNWDHGSQPSDRPFPDFFIFTTGSLN